MPGGRGARHWLWWTWLLGMRVATAAAAECNLGTVIVASVFVTLGAVAIILALVFLVLWRRNRGSPFRLKRTRQASPGEDHGKESAGPRAHVNLAFVDTDSLADAEEGIIGLSPKQGQSPEKKSPSRDGYKKTWTSLPSSDYPDGLQRQVSCGSLDDNFRHMVPEMVSVWLQSQDIIGLGFNISGNMRDGIFVSQVHNRGPAIESGKIKVGDRIVSVTIAYENIVYEDALTILSYASPYPVKVTVQKKRSASVDARTGSSDQLKHPIYRSQSLDALQRIKDPAFRPKRSQSEMKTETRKESDTRKKAVNSKSKSASPQTQTPPRATAARNEVTTDVMVHAPDPRLQDFPEHAASASERARVPGTASPSGQKDADGRKRSKMDAEAARQFANLIEHARDERKRDGDAAARRDSTSPRSVPSKPERRKKPSNTSLALLELEQAKVEAEVEEALRAASGSTQQAVPRDSGQAVTEEQILPSFFERNVVIGSENIEFTLLDNADTTVHRLPPGEAFAGMKIPDWRRPASPDEEVVQEERIEASAASRDALGAPSSTAGARDVGKDREKDKELKAGLDDDMLERLIAMNAFPPGMQGIQAGAEKGGVYDDFVPLETQQSLSLGRANGKTPTSSNHQRQPRGVAFEVRDDVLTGAPVSVQLHRPRRDASRSASNSSSDSSSSCCSSDGSAGVGVGRAVRSSSADAQLGGSDSEELRAYIMRANSMRQELQRRAAQAAKENAAAEEDRLDWSGKRLVRAGSFSQIPQDDSVSDWTDTNLFGSGGEDEDDDDDDSVAGKHAAPGGKVDGGGDPSWRVSSERNARHEAGDGPANMSDLTSSESSSRSAPPPLTNGPACVTTPPLFGHAAQKAGTVIGLQPRLDNNANTKSVTVSASTDDDMDC